MNPVLKNQNNPEFVKLLKASTVSYKNAKSKEILVTYILLFLAFSYPIAYVFFKGNEEVKQSLLAISFLVTILTWFLTDYFKGNTTKGALFKELFDVYLFELPWKFTLSKPDLSEISKLSLEYNAKPIIDWYSKNISDKITRNTTIAICQRVNSGWDAELRLKYKSALIILLIIYTISVFSLCVVQSIDGRTIFLMYCSTLSFYSHFLTLIRGNISAIKKRKALIYKLDTYINSKRNFELEDLRDVQNEIYNIRQEPSKVPDFFFRLYSKRINNEFEDYISDVNAKYNSEIR